VLEVVFRFKKNNPNIKTVIPMAEILVLIAHKEHKYQTELLLF